MTDSAMAYMEQRIAALEAKLAASQAKVAELEGQWEAVRINNQALRAELAAAQAREAKLIEEIHAATLGTEDMAQQFHQLREELAAAHVTIAKMRERLVRIACCPGDNRLATAMRWAEEALAIPSDRSALDAMLAEARKEGMLEAARIAEDVEHDFNMQDECSSAIRQAAERGA